MPGKPTPFDELTDKRQTVLKAIEDKLSDEEFARSQLNAVLYYEDMTSVLDVNDAEEEPTVQTTTDLLNKIAHEDQYLVKTVQGGESAFVIDSNAEEEDGDTVTGVTPSELREIADQVLDRNNVTADLSSVNFGDWNEVIRTVNDLVDKRVLMIKSEPNKYRLREEGADSLRKRD